MMIEPGHPDLSVARQCDLLGLRRSSLYYRPHGEDAFNEQLMRLIDEQYLRTPFYGVGRMTAYLCRSGYAVNPKRVRRLMRVMALEAVYPKPRLSLQNKAHSVYPYLLAGLTIDRPDQVWASDITYIPMRPGWLYLVAIMDWYSRYVLAWEVSVTLDVSFCLAALDRALAGSCPEIFNTDQGSQYTSAAFTDRLKRSPIQISMDGRGRVFDNIFIERLWRSVKYEEVYLHDYQTVAEAVCGLDRYFAFYNHERPHQSLDYRTPAEVYGAWRSEPGGREETRLAATPVALRAPSAAANPTPGDECPP